MKKYKLIQEKEDYYSLYELQKESNCYSFSGITINECDIEKYYEQLLQEDLITLIPLNKLVEDIFLRIKVKFLHKANGNNCENYGSFKRWVKSSIHYCYIDTLNSLYKMWYE